MTELARLLAGVAEISEYFRVRLDANRRRVVELELQQGLAIGIDVGADN